jgi:hypothetical protein
VGDQADGAGLMKPMLLAATITARVVTLSAAADIDFRKL